MATMETTYKLMVNRCEDATVGNKQGSPKYYSKPRMESNGKIEPHNKWKKGYKEQTVKSTETEVWGSVRNIVVPWYSDGKQKHIQSKLGALQSEKDDVKYQGEACVQQVVRLEILDAIALNGLSKVLQVYVEFSIFSDIPDVVIVQTSDGVPLLFVEVKSPERPGHPNEVFGASAILYHAMNYLYSFQQLGFTKPIGIISTYTECAIVSLDSLKTEVDKLDFQKTFRGYCRPQLNNDSACEEDCKKGISPSKKKKKLVDHETRTSKAPNATIYMSQRFKDGQTIQAYIAAIYAANKLEGTTASANANVLLTVEHGDNLCGLWKPHVNADGLDYHIIGGKNGELKANRTEFPHDDCTNFYLLAHCGKGSTGKVFVSATTSGLVCAIKIYIPQRPRDIKAEEREKKFEEAKQEKRNIRDEEARRWDKIYPKMKCRPLTINELPALSMVYGDGIEQGERANVLGKVKDQLTRFAKIGFAYKHSDLRWRHVVQHGGSIFLVDLESLEDISELNEDEKKKRVEEQCLLLRQRMGEAQQELGLIFP